MPQSLSVARSTPFRERGLLKASGRQRTDSTHVLAAVRAVNRLESVGETLRAALNALAAAASSQLRSALARIVWAVLRSGNAYEAGKPQPA